ncbi:terminase large subunit [Roseibium sp. RKSG952]|uniref:terminase large subunit n=1 Tax=Roseibium sp. RKSG952 TaxID=2529384 RepID=UPI0012BD6D20|nr:terminase TerL endonuclease subunit [Roseibium sp. RKSG952]MTH96652.1 terminase large subunit [Roseibium sp. RKSG952]
MTRGEKVIRFIERYCRVPEGKLVGQPLVLDPFQKKFILDIYDNEAVTARAYLSLARKNGKSALIAAIMLAHVVGPEARLNSQIVSGARSRDQAAIVFKHASNMVRLNPDLAAIARIVPSSKKIIGLPMNAEYWAISAEAGTAHGLSPVLAILDEVGQVKGPSDSFIEAIETAQGAYDDALLIAISTQAASDNDLFSRWLDEAATAENPRIVCHWYSADEDAELNDEAAWRAANPALGKFRSLIEMQQAAERAQNSPQFENSFRWLYLNQRIDGSTPFVAKSIWNACGGPVADMRGVPVWCGLDLSATSDLTAFVMIAQIDGLWHVQPTFWLPEHGLREKAKADRAPYDVWEREGLLKTCPGASVDYDFVAQFIRTVCDEYQIEKIAFDRWNFRHFKPWLEASGFDEDEIEQTFEEFGQGYKSISPALRDLEAELLNARVRHGGHPVLTSCIANTRVSVDPAGNRKLDKAKATGRIDGAVALTMAFGVAPLQEPDDTSVYEERGILFL